MMVQEHKMASRRNFLALSGGGLMASALAVVAARAQEGAAGGADNITITQIRNATIHLDYAGVRFLIDPLLAEQGAYPGLDGTPNSEWRNPLTPLPLPVEEIIDVDAVIVTHLHFDHWDEAAKTLLPKTLPIFAQDEADAAAIREAGFEDVRVLGETSDFNGVGLHRTAAQHGSDQAYAVIGEILGHVSGVVFSHPRYQTIYVAGDTIWNDDVRQALVQHRPEIVILNAGDAQITGIGSIIMGSADVLAVHQQVPDALLIAVHMEAINHCVLTRPQLRAFAHDEGFGGQMLIPGDGETITL
jgi:L-ascorbate metabolism protein UlaG (beta-lactamase superfamily)